MKTTARPKTLLLLCGMLALLAGCGGGGGGSTTLSDVTPEAVATATVTGRVSLPEADKSGVLVSLSRTAEGGQSLAVARMLSGEAPLDLELLAHPDRHPERAAAESIFFALTDAQGVYVIRNVPLGNYVVEARRGSALVGQQRAISVDGVSRQVEVEEVFLTPVGILEGTVAFNPTLADLSGVLCYVEGTSLLAITDVSGRYRIEDVPFNTDGTPKTYVITFHRAGFAKIQSSGVTLTSAGAVVTVPPATLTPAAVTSIAIAPAAGATNTFGNEQHFNAASLAFTVTVPAGAPAPALMSWPVFSAASPAPAVSRAPQRAVSFGAWETFAASKTVSFPAEGAFRMQARFMTAAGETIVADMPGVLVCDRTAPDGLAITPLLDDQPEGGDPAKVYGREVRLTLAAQDALSRDLEMAISVDGAAASFVAYHPLRYLLQPLTVAGAAGSHTVQGRFRDRAGNVGTTTYTFENLLPSEYKVEPGEGMIRSRADREIRTLAQNPRIFFGDGASEYLVPTEAVPLHGTLAGTGPLAVYTPPETGDDTITYRVTYQGTVYTDAVDYSFVALTALELELVGNPATAAGKPLYLETVIAAEGVFNDGGRVGVPFSALTFNPPAGTAVRDDGDGPYFIAAAGGTYTISASFVGETGTTYTDTFDVLVVPGAAFLAVRVDGTTLPATPVPSTPGFATIDWTLDRAAGITIFYGTQPVAAAADYAAYGKYRIHPDYAASGSAPLYDLSSNTVYYFRLVAETPAGIETISDEYAFFNGYVLPAGEVVFSSPDAGVPVPAATLPLNADQLLYTFKLTTGTGEPVQIREIAVAVTGVSASAMINLRLVKSTDGTPVSGSTFIQPGTPDIFRFTVDRPFPANSALHLSVHGIVGIETAILRFTTVPPSSLIRGAVTGGTVNVSNSIATPPLGPLTSVSATTTFTPTFGGSPSASTMFGGTYNDGSTDIHFASFSVDPLTGNANIRADADVNGLAFIVQTPLSDDPAAYGDYEFYCDTATSGWSFDQAYHTGTVFQLPGGGSPVEIHLEHTGGNRIVFNVQFAEDTAYAVGSPSRYLMNITGLAAY